MLQTAIRFIEDENGATAIEYAVIAGFLSIAIVTAVSELGTKVASIPFTVG